MENLPGTINLKDGPLGAKFLESYVRTYEYLLPIPPVREDAGFPASTRLLYNDEGELWKDALANRLFETASISMSDFYLLEWIPQSPGLFYTDEARESRDIAKYLVLPDNSSIYDPWGKLRMVDGGVGCLRLLAKNVGGERLKFLAATSSGVVHAGVVVAIRESLYQRIASLIKEEGALFCKNLMGRVCFLPREIAEIRYRKGIPRMYILAEDLEQGKPRASGDSKLDVTVAVTFEGTVKGERGNYFTYAHFDPSKPESLDSCVRWMEMNYVRNRYNGRVLTDFDEEVTHFDSAYLSVRDVMRGPSPHQVSQLSDIFGLNRDDRTRILNIVYNDHRTSLTARDVSNSNIQISSPGAAQTINYEKQSSLDSLQSKTNVIRILFLAANPSDTQRLNLTNEVKSIDDEIQRSRERDAFDLEQRHAVSLSDLQGLLLRFEPQIVHFSGHGSEESALVFENKDHEIEVAPPAALTNLFRIVNDDERKIQCVVMNACYSEKQAEAISNYVPCVIGMSTAISDVAAIKFAASFYRALGYGKSVNSAFEAGCNDIALHNIPEEATPRLKCAPGVNPSQVYFTKNWKSYPVSSDEDIGESQRVRKSRLESLTKQLEIHTQNLDRYSTELAKYGGRDVPARLAHDIEYTENQIAQIEKKIKQIDLAVEDK